MKLPSAMEYAKAIASGCLSAVQLKAVQTLYGFPKHSATATKVANKLNYKGFNGANAVIGTAGRKLAKVLRIKPPLRNTQANNWFSVIAGAHKPGREWIWTMHPEVAKALEQSGVAELGRQSAGINFWVIKARPDRNDFTKFPSRGRTGRWYTARLPKNWSLGDLLFVWAASPHRRIIGVAELTEPNDGYEQGSWRFRVRYLSNPFEGPTIDELRRLAIFRDASFLKSGPAGTVYPLTQRQGLTLQTITDSFSPSVPKTRTTAKDEAMIRRSVGAGFGTPAENQRVERAAVRAVVAHFRRRGWRVRSVEAEKVGYDLDCRKGDEVMRVEVKGVRGTEPRFILTAGEYKRARMDPKFILCVVTSALGRPIILPVTQRELHRKLSVVPLAYKAEISSPLG